MVDAHVRCELVVKRSRVAVGSWSRPVPEEGRALYRYRLYDRDGNEAGEAHYAVLISLRHAAASRLINGGLDPVTVAAVLGHEDANGTLRVYGHLYDRKRTDEDVRRALAGGER